MLDTETHWNDTFENILYSNAFRGMNVIILGKDLCSRASFGRTLINLRCSRNQFLMLPWTWPSFSREAGTAGTNGQQKRNLNWFYYFALNLEWLIGALWKSEVSFVSWLKQLFCKDPMIGHSVCVCGTESMRACLIAHQIKKQVVAICYSNDVNIVTYSGPLSLIKASTDVIGRGLSW